MRIISVLLVFCFVALLAGCTPTLSLPPPEAKIVVLDGARLLTKYPNEQILEAYWPASIAALKPEHVYTTKTGLYICTYTQFVEERGFFVPHADVSITADNPGIDPSYTTISSGLFSYVIKG